MCHRKISISMAYIPNLYRGMYAFVLRLGSQVDIMAEQHYCLRHQNKKKYVLKILSFKL